MDKKLIKVYALLILLTLVTVFISGQSWESAAYCGLLLFFAALKFSLVAFEFMELKKAHSLWKAALSIALGVFVVLIVIIR